MKLLVDARPLLDAKSGGVRRVADGLLSAMEKSRGEHELVRGVTGKAVRIPNKLVNAAAVLRFKSFDRWFDTEKPDLLFLPNLAIVGSPRIPYAVLVHDLSFLVEPRWFDPKSRAWHFFVRPRFLIGNARHVFTVSEDTKRDLVRFSFADATIVTVLPMGIEPLPHLTLADASDASDASPYLLALGLGNPRKNAACAVEAWHIARKKYPELKLVLVGTGKVEQEEGLTVVAHPNDAELAVLMGKAAAFLYPSWYEGFGLPLHEAASFGTPCIASTASALPETAPMGTLFAPPSKPHLWAVAIEEVLARPDAHRTVSKTRSWDEAARMVWKKLEK